MEFQPKVDLRMYYFLLGVDKYQVITKSIAKQYGKRSTNFDDNRKTLTIQGYSGNKENM
jgi:hypothetical protein